MIIFTPINLPFIVPENWDLFWKIWNEHSGPLIKKNKNWSGSNAKIDSKNFWFGLDIFKKPSSLLKTSWEAPFYDISSELPIFYNNLLDIKINGLYKIRIVQSLKNIAAHSDNNIDKWELRGYLHYTSPKSQWYFTRPNELEKTYINMPQETMWFAYNDKYAWHGTDYDPEHKKLLIQFFYIGKINFMVEAGIKKYKNNIINY